MLDENKWLAARHGLDGELVDLPAATRVATKALARRLLDRLREHAQDLGAAAELEGIVDLLERGNGAASASKCLRGQPRPARGHGRDRRGDGAGRRGVMPASSRRRRRLRPSGLESHRGDQRRFAAR